MERIHGALIGGLVLAALVIGLVLSGALRQSPAITAAVARQEAAKAAKLEAEADQAGAQAEIAQNEAEAARLALPAIAASKRWYALAGGIAFGVLAVGLAMAAVTWANVRARTVYPNADGHYPIFVDRFLDGSLRVLDTSRGLGPVTRVALDGAAAMPLPASEAAALRLATQAQAAAVMIGVSATSHSGADVAERVKRAAGALPAPTFASAGEDGLQMVYVKGGAQSKAERERQDSEEFIRRGWAGGLARSRWMGEKFQGTGNRIGRTYYDELCRMLARAGVIADEGDGWRPLVSVDEALDAFGLAHSDSTSGSRDADGN